VKTLPDSGGSRDDIQEIDPPEIITFDCKDVIPTLYPTYRCSSGAFAGMDFIFATSKAITYLVQEGLYRTDTYPGCCSPSRLEES